MVADAATGVDDVYSRDTVIQTVIKPRFYRRLRQFLTKITPVINCVCACVRTSAEDDNFPREDGGCVCLMTAFNLRVFMFWFVGENIPGTFGFARY